VRPPNCNTSSSSVSLRRKLLREYFSQVAIVRDEQVGHGNGVTVVAVVIVVAVLVDSLGVVVLPFLLPGGGSLAVVLVGGGRRERHEEVNLAALEVSVGRNHDDLGNDAVLGGGRGWLLEHVFGVRLHDLAGLHGAADFLDAAVGVHYTDYVQCSAWKNARNATPYAVSHYFFFCSLSLGW